MKASACVVALCAYATLALGQPSDIKKSSPDTDTSFVQPFQKRNEVRITYGTKSSVLSYGSTKTNASGNSGSFNNVSDFVGIGFTYKLADFDFAFSLPQTRLLPQGLQNLEQFRLSGSYYGRRWTIHGYVRDSRGLVVSDDNGQFQSTPDVHLMQVCLQFTLNFNPRRYSFKAANFQNEWQRRSSGGFLLRLEPYYRKVGIGSTLVPATLDVPATYGEQTGLKYVNTLGFSVLPGYGHNVIIRGTNFFIAPYLLAGAGAAFSGFDGNQGKKTKFSVEWITSASLQFGYNGPLAYASVRFFYETHYFKLNPSYFQTADWRAMIVGGYRFGDIFKKGSGVRSQGPARK